MASAQKTSFARSHRQVWPHRARPVAAFFATLAAVGALFVLSPVPPAHAADFTFLVNSLSHQGDDLVPGDGACLTSTGLCTLRAALQESNARPAEDVVTIAPDEDVDAATPGIQSSGTIVGSGSGAANWMHVGALTTWGDGGALFMATRPVTLDFQDRLGIASLNDANGVTAIYLNGPDVAVRNFSNVKSNETAFVVGGAGDGSTIENGSSIDPGSINLERFLWLANGADGVTVRNVEMGSLYAGGGSAIRVAAGAIINDLTLDGIRMYDPDTEPYDGFAFDGTTLGELHRLRVVGSTFEGFGAGRTVFNLGMPLITGSEISGNTFVRNNVTTSPGLIFIRPPATDLGTGAMNVIARNVFDSTGAIAQRAIFVNPTTNPARTQFAYRIEDNYFDAFTTTAVLLQNTGQLSVQRNTFGPASFGGGAAIDELGTNTLLRNGTNANGGISTWFPTAVTYDTDACTLEVTVTPGGNPQPQTPVTLDVYFTPTTKAEVFLGRVEGVTAAGTITVPYTLGAGNIRLQTIGADGSSSQYSRVLAQTTPDGCSPTVTVEQDAGQADPTSVRDISYVATFSEAITAELAPTAFSTTGSTAPGAAVATVTRLSSTTFAVTARANGTGTVVVSLPEGAVADPAGNPSAASTSVDNEVTYQSPLTLAPTSLSVTEGEPGVTYTVTNALAATAPITVAQTVADPSWATVTPTPLVLATIQTSADATVEAVDDTIVNGTRTTSILHTVSSADPNFDGLLLDPIAVTVFDDDAPTAANSDLAVTAGTVTANGTDAHTATATVRNAEGQLLSGVLVTFQVAPELSPSATSCTTTPAGTCTIQLTSTTPGAHPVSAFLNGSEELTGSPATAAFAVGAADATTSTIAASALTLPADGVSSSVITVTLFDANGNPLTTGGDTVVFLTTAGALSSVVDNGDGTYTATLTAETVVGEAVVSFTANGTPGTQTVTINFVAGEPSASTSTIDATPATVIADGVSTSTVTVTLIDGYGNPVAAGGDAVVIATTAGALGGVTDNGDGTYTATLTAPTAAGTATLTFTVNGAQATDTATVDFVAGAVDPGASTIDASPASLVADGVSQSSVTVTLRDANGNLVTTPATVEIMTDAGTLTAVTAGGDGTYTAVLTAPTTPGTATLSFTVNGAAGGATATVQFLVGAPDADASLIAADPPTITADGVATSTITVTVRDAQGNVLTEGGADVDLSTDAGALGPVSDNGDGTYTATLTSATTAGTATVTFTVNGVTSANTATVEFVAGAPAASASTITAAPASVTADGVDSSMITVTLFDANGNPVTTGGASVVLSSDLGTLGSVSDNGDGTYTAFLTSTVAGLATVTFTVNGVAGTATATVEFLPGAPDPTLSTIAADPTSITADGASTSTVTVTAIDANGNPLTVGGSVVTMATDAGTLGPVTDNGDGTYTATLTSPTTAGTATITFEMDAVAGTDTASVEFVPGAADATTATITADPTTLTADGTSTSTITVTLFDANGNPLTTSGDTVEVATDLGTLGPVTDNGDGTYTATLTSATTAGTATVTFTVNGTPATDTATVELVPGAADADTSTITADPTVITADGASTSTITVTLLDANGNPLTTGGDTVELATDLGTLGPVTDNSDGTYTATLISATTAGTATVTFTVNGTPATDTATVAFVPGAADADTSTITADPTVITADGASTSTITVTLLDANGNPLTSGGDTVEVATDLGTLGAVTDNGDGTYTATLTSATTAGAATVSFSVNGVASATTATVEFVAGAPAASASTIDATPATVTADGVDSSTITVTLFDANGNPITAGGADVVITSDLGTVGPVSDNGDGTYTATLTSTVAGVATITFTLNSAAGDDTATVEFLPGPPDATTSTIAADPTSITADGVSTSTITVTALDANGNPVSGSVVTMATDAGNLGPVTDNGDGTYTATLTSSTTAGTATITFEMDAVAGTATASVEFIAGAADATTTTITATPTLLTADGTSTSTVTVTVLDANGNPLGIGGDTVEVFTTAGTLGAVTDNGDGTYTATLTSPTVAGTATLTFELNGTAGTATATVEFVPGAADAGTATIAADPTTLTADGTSTSTITVTLFDANGNPLTAGGDTVEVATDLGTLGTVTDNGDGTYTATLTSATTAGTATVTFTVNGTPATATATATVAFVPDAADAGTSTITADPTVITADSASTSTITVTLLDANSNPLTTGGDTIELATDLGTLSTVTDNGDGTYTATLTSATTAGTATVTFSVNGTPATNTATVEFVAGAADPGTSLIDASPTSITANGTSTSTVTVTLLDAQGNQLPAGGETVVLATDLGTLGAVTDNGDGTYTATLTSATTAGTATVTFTVNGAPASATAAVEFTPGAADLEASTIAANPTEIVADGASTSTITVTLFDANGNQLSTGGAVVVLAASAGTLSPVVDNADGTYTATLTSSTSVEVSTISFTVDGAPGTRTVGVAFTADAPDPGTSTITAAPPSITADGVSTSTVTVTLLDTNGNPVTDAGDIVAVATDLGTLSAVTDNGDGTYTAILTSSTTAGTATVSFTVDGAAGEATASVEFIPGLPDAGASTITAAPGSITADGVSTATVTVTLTDAFGNPVTSAGDIVTMATTTGTLSAVTDNGDGTYNAILTSSTTAGTATVSFTVDGAAGVATASVAFTPGAADAGTATITAAPGILTADGVSTSTVTVTLFDAFGNRVTNGGDAVTLSTTLGSVSGVTDNGDGTYAATLTAGEAAGTATLSFAVNGTPADATATVTFVAGTADVGTSTIAASPSTLTADGVSTSTVTVTLRDSFGNLVTAGDVVAISTSAGSVSAAVDNGDGTWTATLTAATTAGTATLTFSVDGVTSPNTATVAFVPGAADPAASTIAAAPTSITADGVSTSTITVTLIDATGNPLGSSGGTVTMATTAGTLSAVTDNGDGTYTATLTSSTAVETATISFTTPAGGSPNTATVMFVAGAPSASLSTITADPAQLPADGVSTSLVTVTLLDANGNPTGATGAAVTMATTAGTLSAVTDNGDGTYTATLTSPTATTPPLATITFTVDSDPGAATATVTFVAGVPSGTTSTIAASPTSVIADGVSTSTITVTLRDGNGNVVPDAGPIVAMTATAGTLSGVTDNGDGTYTATLTAPTTVGSATISFTVAGVPASSTATVAFTAGPPDAGSATIVASPTSIPANGVSTSAVTVTLFDANGNRVVVGGSTVVMMTDAGTLSAVTDNGDGTYTATLTSSVAVGTATLTFTVDGVAAPATATVSFTVGPADPDTSTIAAAPVVIESDGEAASVITVTLFDANGNPRGVGGSTVTMSTTIGTLGPVTDNGDGTYIAALTSTAIGIATITFTVDGISAPASATVTVQDTTPPAPPVITAPSDGAHVPPTFPITGTGEPGAIIEVRDAAGSVVCTAAVDASGAWMCFPGAPFPEGAATLTATQSDPSGNVSAASTPVTVTVDGTPPPPPVPAPTNGREFTGTSEPGTIVTVSNTGGGILCVTTADAAGAFRCIPAVPVPEGTLVSFTATDAAGNESAPSLARVGGPSLTLELLLAEPGDIQVAHGRGFLPGETVTGVLTSTPLDLGTQVADLAGNVEFSFTLPADISAGTHTVTLTGPLSGSVSVTFEVAEVAPTPSPTPAPIPDPAPLPPTGVDGLRELVGWALVLIIVGFGLTKRGTSLNKYGNPSES